MTKDEIVRELMPDVQTAARTVAREWADVIDVDDAEQEIWFRLLELTPAKLEEVHALDKPIRIKLLTEIGHQVGMKYRDDFELFSGNYYYGTREVREMLDNDAIAGVEEGSIGPLWELPESVISQINKTDTETVTERIDLLLGMKSLARRNGWYEQVIVANYLTDDPVHAHSQELTRAVDTLTREMNNVHRRRVAEYTEGPGTRAVLTNTQAQKLTRSDYSR